MQRLCPGMHKGTGQPSVCITSGRTARNGQQSKTGTVQVAQPSVRRWYTQYTMMRTHHCGATVSAQRQDPSGCCTRPEQNQSCPQPGSQMWHPGVRPIPHRTAVHSGKWKHDAELQFRTPDGKVSGGPYRSRMPVSRWHRYPSWWPGSTL